MKKYESVPKSRLTPRVPVLMRMDGRAFHTFTRGLARPYDARFHRCMWRAATALCEEVSGCKLAYVQSDEISLLLTDYETHNTQPWFDYEVQKICSVAASVATGAFFIAYLHEFPEAGQKILAGEGIIPSFDARCWNVPKEEVCNAFLWRQQDAERNSLSMLCQANFSHSQLQGKSRAQQHEMLHGIGLNWNDCATPQKRGVCITRETYTVEGPEGPVTRHRWVADQNIPIFSQDRSYIERYL